LDDSPGQAFAHQNNSILPKELPAAPLGEPGNPQGLRPLARNPQLGLFLRYKRMDFFGVQELATAGIGKPMRSIIKPDKFENDRKI